MEFKILSVEIMDHNEFIEDGEPKPSNVSVIVNVQVADETYLLDFQTTETMDCGSYSSSLAAYHDGYYDNLADAIDDDDKIEELVDQIKKSSNAQQIWREYISNKYEVSEDQFGGIDARSEVNEMVKTHGGKRSGSGRHEVADPRRARQPVTATDEEWAEIKLRAKGAGKSINEYLVSRALG